MIIMDSKIKEIFSKLEKQFSSNIEFKNTIQIFHKAIGEEYNSITIYQQFLKILKKSLLDIDTVIARNQLKTNPDLLKFKQKVENLSVLINQIINEEMNHVKKLLPALNDIYDLSNIRKEISKL